MPSPTIIHQNIYGVEYGENSADIYAISTICKMLAQSTIGKH